MTNDSKAEEISMEIMGVTSHIDDRAYAAAMKMAQWKDNQAADAYCKCCDTRECEDYESDTCDWLEKFKKVLKGGEK